MHSRQSTGLFLLLASFGLLQCGGNQREPMEADRRHGASDFMVPASRVDESRGAEQGRTEETNFSDGQIAMTSDAAHNAAIDAARVAYAKTENERVKAFAQMMLADHGKAKQEETALLVERRIAPEESELSTRIGVASGQTLFAMRETGSGPIDRTYIDSQLASHEDFLKMLDDRLIPNANDPELKRLLQSFRERVKVHIEEAREIKEEFAAETVPAPPVGSPSMP